MKIQTVDALDLDGLEAGQVHKRWLAMADDALGLPHRVPVLIARGSSDGPVLGITAAIHGDEVNGVAVIHQLFRKLDPARICGTVVAVPVANSVAFHLHQRRMLEGVDLNHIFPGDPHGNFGQVYAHRFLHRVVQPLDVLVDIHTASRGRANCLYVRVDLDQPEAAVLADLQRPQIILHSPPSDGTLRGAAEDMGIPAITVEVGNPARFQPEIVRRTSVGLRAVMGHLEMITHKKLSPHDPPVICDSSRWLYTDDGGLLEVFPKVTARVDKDEPIARLVDPFGSELRTYTAPWDGIVIGRSVDPVAAAGARILHLGRIAKESG